MDEATFERISERMQEDSENAAIAEDFTIYSKSEIVFRDCFSSLGPQSGFISYKRISIDCTIALRS